MGETIRIVVETDFDFEQTSKLARASFGKRKKTLSADRFRWSYTKGYEQILVLSAMVGDKKVGQVAVVISNINIDEAQCKAAELVDLFVSPENRRRAVSDGLYAGLKKFFAQNDIEYLFTFPNKRAQALNSRHLELEQFSKLPIYIGMRRLFTSARAPKNYRVYDDPADFFEAYALAFKYGLVDWNADTFTKRLANPLNTYICAGDGNVGFIGSPRKIRGISMLLICGSYCNNVALFSKRRAAEILSSMCLNEDVRLYLYPGWNRRKPSFPGRMLPAFLGGEKFMIQSNFIERPGGVSKLELIDIDYG